MFKIFFSYCCLVFLLASFFGGVNGALAVESDTNKKTSSSGKVKNSDKSSNKNKKSDKNKASKKISNRSKDVDKSKAKLKDQAITKATEKGNKIAKKKLDTKDNKSDNKKNDMSNKVLEVKQNGKEIESDNGEISELNIDKTKDQAIDIPEISGANNAILIEYETGDILYSKNKDDRVYPSSMTKIMTAYVVMEKLKNGELKLSDQIKISKNAFEKKGSTMFLKTGDVVSLDDLMKGLIVHSGNDAATAIAEFVAGSEDNFVKLMNKKAKEMGLENTNFANVTGLYADNHYMSVADTAKIGAELIKNFPEYYKYFSIKEFKYGKISQRNRNTLLGNFDGVDGMKTGYTSQGKYGIIASAKVRRINLLTPNAIGEVRLIAVINGASSEVARIQEVSKLLKYGIDNFVKLKLVEKKDVDFDIDVFGGKKSKIKVELKNDIEVNLHKDMVKNVRVKLEYKKPLVAPIKSDDEIARIVVEYNDEVIKQVPIPAQKSIEKASKFSIFRSKLITSIKNSLKL